MEPSGSVTHWLADLQSGDAATRQEAAAAIWQRYSQQLLDLARQYLHQRVRQREDENDVLQSMYKSFCIRLQQGKFQLDSRGDLWKLLVAMTINKARHVWARHTREVRDVGREQAPPTDDADAETTSALGQLAAHEPTPDEAVQLSEGLERLLTALGEPRLGQIVLWKLEGYTNQEIADQLDCAVRTVERKLHLIRRKWEEVSS